MQVSIDGFISHLARCIMQGSDGDKAIKLPKMRLIYQQAAFTIVAAVSNSAKDGFLHVIEESDYLIHPIEIPYLPGDGNDANNQVILSHPSYYKRWKNSINSRAWIFQELHPLPAHDHLHL